MGATLKEIVTTLADSGWTVSEKRVGMWTETDPYDQHVTAYYYNTRLTILTDGSGGTSLTLSNLSPGYSYGVRDHVLITEEASSWLRGSTSSGTEIPYRATSVTVAATLKPNTTYYVWLVNNGGDSDQFLLSAVTVSVTGSYGTAGTASAPNGHFGKAIPITISGHSPSARFTLKLSCAGNTETLLQNSANTSVNWTPAVATYAPLVTGPSASAAITVETWYNGAKLYTETRSITVSWAAGTLPPALSSGWASAAPLNEGAASGFTVWIQKYSKARVSFTPSRVTTQYGAAIRSFTVKLGSSVYTASNNRADTGLITTTGASLLCTVTDSRGQTASQTLSVTLHAYANPALSAVSLFRCASSGTADEDGTYLSVKATATISSLGGQNRHTLSVQSRRPGGAWGGATALNSGTAKILGGFSPDLSYELRLTLTDALGNSASYSQSFPTRKWAMQFRPDGSGVAFGKAAEHDRSLQIPADWEFRRGEAPLKLASYSAVTQLGFVGGSATIAGVYDAMPAGSLGLFSAAEFAASQFPGGNQAGSVLMHKFSPSARGLVHWSHNGGEYRMLFASSTLLPDGVWRQLEQAYVSGDTVSAPFRGWGRSVNAGNAVYIAIPLGRSIAASSFDVSLSSVNIYTASGGAAYDSSRAFGAKGVSGNLVSFSIPITTNIGAGVLCGVEINGGSISFS